MGYHTGSQQLTNGHTHNQMEKLHACVKSAVPVEAAVENRTESVGGCRHFRMATV